MLKQAHENTVSPGDCFLSNSNDLWLACESARNELQAGLWLVISGGLQRRLAGGRADPGSGDSVEMCIVHQMKLKGDIEIYSS